MIICINYSDDGERFIAYIEYGYRWGRERTIELASYLSTEYDEVYIIDFKDNKEFIDEVVLRGCRV